MVPHESVLSPLTIKKNPGLFITCYPAGSWNSIVIQSRCFYTCTYTCSVRGQKDRIFFLNLIFTKMVSLHRLYCLSHCNSSLDKDCDNNGARFHCYCYLRINKAKRRRRGCVARHKNKILLTDRPKNRARVVQCNAAYNNNDNALGGTKWPRRLRTHAIYLKFWTFIWTKFTKNNYNWIK